MHSAYLYEAPANHADYLVWRGSLVSFGVIDKLPPSKGLKMLVKPPRPPPGEYHYETKQSRLVAAAVVCLILMLSVTGARIWLKARTLRWRLGPDDWLIIAGCIAGCACPALNMTTVLIGGVGKHIYDVTYAEYAHFTNLAPLRSIVLYFSLALVKLSIVAFYMRLNGFTSRGWRIAHWLLIFYITALLFSSVFIFAFQCVPVRSRWDIRYEGTLDAKPKCVYLLHAIIAMNVWHISSDCLLLAVPVAMLWKVKMKWSTKFRVWVAGMVGCVNIILSVVRTIVNKQINSDLSWNYSRISAYAMAEITIGVITASLPVLSVLVTRFFTWIDKNGTISTRSQYVFNRAKRAVKRRPDSAALYSSDHLDRSFESTHATPRYLYENPKSRGVEVAEKEQGPPVLTLPDLERDAASNKNGWNVTTSESARD